MCRSSYLHGPAAQRGAISTNQRSTKARNSPPRTTAFLFLLFLRHAFFGAPSGKPGLIGLRKTLRLLLFGSPFRISSHRLPRFPHPNSCMAQLAARCLAEAKVGGSIPPAGYLYFFFFLLEGFTV